MEQILGGELGDENQRIFDRIWQWFIDNRITEKEHPQVMSDPNSSYHVEGIIGIKESHGNEDFPLGAVMLEEILHYVTSSDDEESSADYSPKFLDFIFRLIINQLGSNERNRKRDGQDFQSMLIRCLWKIIQPGGMRLT
jgi:hypothetical protein